MRRGQGNMGQATAVMGGARVRGGGHGHATGVGSVRLGRSGWHPRACPIGWWRDRAAEAGCVELLLPSLLCGRGKQGGPRWVMTPRSRLAAATVG